MRYLVTPTLQGERKYSNKNGPDIDTKWTATTWDNYEVSALGDHVTPAQQDAANLQGITAPARIVDFTFSCNGPPDYNLTFTSRVSVPATFTYSYKAGDLVCGSGGTCCQPPGIICGGACASDADCSKQTTIVSKDTGFTEKLFGETASAKCQKPVTDPAGDYIDSESSIKPAFTQSQVDILGYRALQSAYTQAEVDDLFNKPDAVYPCGKADSTLRVICDNGGATPMPPGPIDRFFVKLGAPVPINDALKSYIYSLVLDSDSDPANNWIPQAPYDWDYFQGTDMWFQAVWDHTAKTWSISGTQVDATQTTAKFASAVRALVQKDTVTFYVPASRFPAQHPGYRVTAFGHDGNFTVSSRGGDASGGNPTEALTPGP